MLQILDATGGGCLFGRRHEVLFAADKTKWRCVRLGWTWQKTLQSRAVRGSFCNGLAREEEDLVVAAGVVGCVALGGGVTVVGGIGAALLLDGGAEEMEEVVDAC